MQAEAGAGAGSEALSEEAARRAGRTPSIWGDARWGLAPHRQWRRKPLGGGAGNLRRDARFDTKPARSPRRRTAAGRALPTTERPAASRTPPPRALLWPSEIARSGDQSPSLMNTVGLKGVWGGGGGGCSLSWWILSCATGRANGDASGDEICQPLATAGIEVRDRLVSQLSRVLE